MENGRRALKENDIKKKRPKEEKPSRGGGGSLEKGEMKVRSRGVATRNISAAAAHTTRAFTFDSGLSHCDDDFHSYRRVIPTRLVPIRFLFFFFNELEYNPPKK